MSLFFRRSATFSGLVGLALVLAALIPASAETCLSPFVERLDRPEKVLYVFCVDADAKDNDDFLAVDRRWVGSNRRPTAPIVNQLDLGSSGNETHHFGLLRRTARTSGVAACSPARFSSSTWPKLIRRSRSWSRFSKTCREEHGLSGPHSPYALPGRMMISFLAGKDGGLPAGLAEFTNEGKYIRTFAHAEGFPLRLRRGHQAGCATAWVTSSFTSDEQLQEAAGEDGPRRTSARICSSGISAIARYCKS